MDKFKSSSSHHFKNLHFKTILAILFFLLCFPLLSVYTQISEEGKNENNNVSSESEVANWYYASGNIPFPARCYHTSVVFNNKMWVIGGYDSFYNFRNDVWYSTDGVIWTEATAYAAFPARDHHTSVVYNNKMWVIGGYYYKSGSYYYRNDVWYSTDGVSWSQATASAAFLGRYGHTSVVYNNKIWVIGGYYCDDSSHYLNDIWYSTDGVSWSQATASAAFPGREYHTSIVFNNKMWVIGGYDGNYRNDVWYSTDGVVWTQTASATFPAREYHTSVVFNNKMWVIGGYGDGGRKNDAWYSTDGEVWTQATAAATFPASWGHTSVVFNNKMWVIGGYDGSFRNDVWYSTDGVVWTQATTAASFPARLGHTCVVFNNKIWIIGGYSGIGNIRNDVWYSIDGVSWSQATASAAFPGRGNHTSVVYNNKMWVIGGYDGNYRNDVWYSTDGVSWVQATASAAFPGREYHTSIVFNNKMWVIGGYDGNYRNDVWYSTDGVVWTQTASATFPAREYHTSVVFNNKMWVIGGYGDGGRKNDAWYSTDGVVWTQATASAAFTCRIWHTSVVFNNKMWVIGGADNDGYRNDVWYSTDGAVWTQATASAALPVCSSHTSVVFNNKMWVIGGYVYGFRNDVWYSSSGLENLVVNFYQEDMLPSPKVSGACCDGEVIIILLIQSNKDGEVEVSIVGNDTEGKFGRLIGSISPTEPVIISVVDGIGQALYQVPSSYPDANTTFNFRFNESGTTTYIDAGQKTLELSKTPVIMLHGLWEDPKVWKTMISVLKNNGFKFLHAHSYKKTNAEGFNVNKNVTKNAVEKVKARALHDGFATKNVDVVAHSTGGILTRYYIEDLGDILYQEDIRKFITIGTPHSGSQFADLLVLGRPFTSMMSNPLGFNIDQGTIDDLKVTNSAIDSILNLKDNLGVSSVSSHSIVGVSALTGIEGWPKVLWEILQFLFPTSTPNLLLGIPNDYIVGAISQNGNLSGNYTQEIQVISHTSETYDLEIMTAVIDLLNEAPIASIFPSFDSNGFVNPVDIDFLWSSSHGAPSLPLKKSSGNGIVTITSPIEGNVFSPGETISVSVEATGTINKVLIMCPFDAELITTPPYEYSFNIPLDYIGELIIASAGRDDEGFIDDDSIEVYIVTPSVVNNIILIPEDYLPLHQNEMYEVFVLGDFSDGITRDITSHITGTTYLSENPSIATVSVDGIIETKDIGTTNIVVTNNVSKELEVEVLEESMPVYVKIFELYE